ncbi:hypothetical protein BH10PSE2_BH10PSE2_21490 [soil metagenome]
MTHQMRPLTVLSALVLCGFGLSGCGKTEAPTQTAAAPVAPAAPAMTAGQRMQDRRAQTAQQQIEAQMQSQMDPVPVQKDERKQ